MRGASVLLEDPSVLLEDWSSVLLEDPSLVLLDTFFEVFFEGPFVERFGFAWGEVCFEDCFEECFEDRLGSLLEERFEAADVTEKLRVRLCGERVASALEELVPLSLPEDSSPSLDC